MKGPFFQLGTSSCEAVAALRTTSHCQIAAAKISHHFSITVLSQATIANVAKEMTNTPTLERRNRRHILWKNARSEIGMCMKKAKSQDRYNDSARPLPKYVAT